MGFRERLIEKMKNYNKKTTQKVVFASEVTVMLNEELRACLPEKLIYLCIATSLNKTAVDLMSRIVGELILKGDKETTGLILHACKDSFPEVFELDKLDQASFH